MEKYTGKDTDVTIPYGVTKTGEWAFQGYESLTSITIPYGVAKIGKSAFEDCEKLIYAIVPK